MLRIPVTTELGFQPWVQTEREKDDEIEEGRDEREQEPEKEIGNVERDQFRERECVLIQDFGDSKDFLLSKVVLG